MSHWMSFSGHLWIIAVISKKQTKKKQNQNSTSISKLRTQVLFQFVFNEMPASWRLSRALMKSLMFYNPKTMHLCIWMSRIQQGKFSPQGQSKPLWSSSIKAQRPTFLRTENNSIHLSVCLRDSISNFPQADEIMCARSLYGKMAERSGIPTL